MSDPRESAPARSGGAESEAGEAHYTESTTQPDTDARRLEGQDRADWAADVAWARACDATIAMLAASGDLFTADECEAICGPPVAPSNKVMGARFSAAARADIIEAVGYRESLRVSGRVLRVWRGTVGP